MDVSLLTIGNMLGQPAGSVQVSPRSDAPARDTRFSLTRDRPRPAADTTGPATPPQAHADAPVEPPPEGREDFKEVIDDQTKHGNLEKARDHREPARQCTESNASEQPDAAQTGPVQNPAGTEQNKGAVTSASEPRASQQLVELIEGGKSQNVPPATAKNLKSSQIKLAETTTNKQSGSEAVTSDSIKNISVNTGSPKNAGKLPIPHGATADTQAIPKGSDAKQPAPEASVIDGAKSANAGKERTIVTDSPVAVPAKAPATSTSTGGASIDGGVRTKNASESAAVPDADKVRSPRADTQKAVQPVQTQPSASNSDKIGTDTNDPPTAETEAGSASQQTPARPTGVNGRNSGHLDKNIENAPLEPGKVQAAADQTETGDSSHSGSGSLPDSAQILAQTPAQTPVFSVEAEQPATTTPSDPLGDVSNQILESVRSSLSQQTGDKEIAIQLHPPELGKVSVKFQEQGTEITGTLEVSKAQTRAEIEQALPEIIRSLADSGVAIKRLEVVLSQDEQSQQHGSRDPLLQDGAFQQRDSAHPGQSGNEQHASQTYYGPTARYQYQNAIDPHDMLVTNTSINMLV